MAVQPVPVALPTGVTEVATAAKELNDATVALDNINQQLQATFDKFGALTVLQANAQTRVQAAIAALKQAVSNLKG